ncbi:spindle and kinetochore-associated protein 3 [Rana temporaria]|uniref:spindle and kinetochore-associated protein 3 n=1 Tax=Rana temporaria TaxID=8407 RepID=UPI001AADAF91|nr:spindle and kinetochore-associated protein 3 [Rana temporaria]XP_040196461.1 spindle and kinetochore-associated protein 3 [Rana temporaria]
MSVTGNFFCKLRSLAITLEKETTHLDQVFNQEESDYEDESPMRVLHDLRSEIIGLKTDIQGTINRNVERGDELNAFLKICRVLQARNCSDIHQIKDTFQKYGYKPSELDTSENEIFNEDSKPDGAAENNHSTGPADLPPDLPAMQKLTISDLRAPQLSDFGLSYYPLPIVREPKNDKWHDKVPEEKPKPLYKDIRTLNVAKTPKCALTREEDFSQIQHFGISDYSNNLNDDYTIALFNKKKGSVADYCTKETSQNLKSMLTTPAHQKYKNDFYSDSPLPPMFCTPGLKVHKKETFDSNQPESIRGGSDSSEECSSSQAVHSVQALERDRNGVNSPQVPTFCTPGLKAQKKEIMYGVEKPVEYKEVNVIGNLDTPPIPSFETRWLKTDTTSSHDITGPIPRPEMSHTVYLEQAAPLGINSDKYGNPAKPMSPPKMRDFTIGTPPRPELAARLTEDVFKNSIKPASPPKVSGYENLLWTPTKPEMTTCITEDISQLLSRYCENKTKPSWQDPQGMYTRNRDPRDAGNKENRP